MQVIPNIKPTPRLLDTAAVEVRSSGAAVDSKHRLKRAGSFGGNGRAIFIGLLLGALVVTAAGYFSQHRDSAEHHLASVRRFFAVRTSTVFVEKPDPGKAGPIRVEIHPSMLRVTAIALGHPRLAIINGKEVTEGDSLTLNSPDGSVSVTLRIVNIVEGRIELTDGTKVMTAPFVAGAKR